MDPRLLRAQLYSGSVSPGSGPWKLTAPISPVAARTLVVAFNGGFKFPARRAAITPRDASSTRCVPAARRS